MQNGSSKHVRLLVAIATLAVIVLAVTAASSAAPSGKAASQDDHITVGLPGIPPIFLDVRQYVAQDGGYYKHYGANVTLKQFITGVDALRAVNAGQIQAAWAPTPPALSLMAKNPQLVGISGMDVVDWLVGSIDGSVKTCSDLKGQTIGVDTVGGARYAALQAMLSRCKLTIQDVKTVNFPGAAAMQSMIAGQLKTSVLHIDELAQIEKSGKTVNVNVRLTQVDPYQHYDLLVTTRDQIKLHYYDFVHLLAGDIATTRYMYNPKAIGKVAKIATITGVDEQVATSALKQYIAMKWWPLDKSGLGQGRITRTIGLNVKLGNLPPNVLTWKSVVDNRMWKAAFALVKKRQGK